MRDLIDRADQDGARPLTEAERKQFQYFNLWLDHLSNLLALLEAKET
jgi:hypothetical protein